MAEKIKVDVNSKVFKYYKHKREGLPKTKAAQLAGYGLQKAKQPGSIEKTQAYQALERHFKDELVSHITMNEVALELSKVVRQDEEMGAKIQAIKLAKDTFEPEKVMQDEEKVIIVLKG
jgi:hypothetical protein